MCADFEKGGNGPIFWDTNLFIYLWEDCRAAVGGSSRETKMLRRRDQLLTSKSYTSVKCW